MRRYLLILLLSLTAFAQTKIGTGQGDPAAGFTIGLGTVQLTQIIVTPDPSWILVGGTKQFTATGVYSNSSNVDITSQVSWSSATPAIATINSSGLATGAAANLAPDLITASLQGVTSNAASLYVTVITISPSSLSAGTQGTAYGPVTFTESGGTPADTWSYDVLPPGLALNASTGVLNGTPTTPGTTSTTISVTDSHSLTQTKTYSIVINPPAGLTLQTSPPPPGTATGAQYNFLVVATGGTPPYTCPETNCVSVGALPNGISGAIQNGSSPGVLLSSSNVQATSGSYNFTLHVRDSAGSPANATQSYTITVGSDLAVPIWSLLPTTFIDTSVADGPYDVTTYVGFPSCPANFGVCDYTTPKAALDAWCATGDQQWSIVMTSTGNGQAPFTAPSVSTGWTLCSKDGAVNGRPAKYAVLTSDDPLPDRTPCSHGITDPTEIVPNSPDPGYRNPGCDGTALGQQQEFITPHSDSSYNDRQHMWAMTESGIFNSVISTDNTTHNNFNSAGYAPSHIVFRNMELYPLPTNNIGGTQPIDISASCNTVNCVPSYIAIENSYLHTDTDENGIGRNITSNMVAFGCSYCWIKNVYIDHVKRDAAEGHGIGFGSTGIGPYKITGLWDEVESIGLFSGGAACAMFDASGNCLVPTDVEIKRSRFSLPLWWGDEVTTYGRGWSFGPSVDFVAGLNTLTNVTCPLHFDLVPGSPMQISSGATGAGSGQELIAFSGTTNCPAGSTTGTLQFTAAKAWSHLNAQGKQALYLTTGSVGTKNRLEFKSAKRWWMDAIIFENSYVGGQQFPTIIHPGGGCAGSTCNALNNLGQWVSGTTEGTDVLESNVIYRHASNGPAWVGRYGGWTQGKGIVTGATCVGGTEVDLTISPAMNSVIDYQVPVYLYGTSGLTNGDNWYWAVQGATSSITTTSARVQAVCTTPVSVSTITGRIGTTGGNLSARMQHVIFQNVLAYDIGNYLKWGGKPLTVPYQSTAASIGASGNIYSYNATRDNAGKVTATVVAMGEWPLPRAGGPAEPDGPPPLMTGITGAAQSPTGHGDLVYAQCAADSSIATGAVGSQGVEALDSDPTGTVVQWQTNVVGQPISSPGVFCRLPPWDGPKINSGLTNGQGGTRYFWWNHVTLAGTGIMKVGGGAIYQQFSTLGNTLLLQEPAAGGGGFQISGHSEGTSSVSALFDTSTLNLHDWAMSNLTSSKYTGSGTNLTFPTSNACPSGITTTCVGMTHFTGSTPFTINPSDYHYFQLDPASAYSSAGIYKASDGLDNGVILNLIDNAFARRQLQCPQGSACYGLACGSGGPCKDNSVIIEDLTKWMMMSSRTTKFMSGTNSEGSWKGADGKTLYHVKCGTNCTRGYPWDIRQYDNSNPATDKIYWWITDNSFTLDPTAYKRFVTPVPLVPRFLARGATYDTGEIPGPNTLKINAGQIATGAGWTCTGSETTTSLGHIRGITSWEDHTWTITGVGTLTLPTLLVNYYWGGINGSPDYNKRERYYFTPPYGLLQWDSSDCSSGITCGPPSQTSTFNVLNTNAGSAAPQFTCSDQSWWTVGQPGVGGNAP